MRTFDTERINKIMKEHGVRRSFEDFQRAVNVTFHRFEAEVYDRQHQCMWESLPDQFELLANDIVSQLVVPESLNILDVGSGTGLSSELLLRTRLGAKVRTITLLDTSPEMLARAMERSKKWGQEVIPHLGELDSLQSSFDLILTCSVLHHIPDLSSFLNGIVQRLKPGSLYLHLQDPNADYLDDPVLKERMAMVSTHSERISIKDRLRWKTNQLLGKKGYIQRFNDVLISEGWINKPMSDEEIWCFTDLHDTGGFGISIKDIQSEINQLRLLSHRAYAFFGKMLSELPPRLKAEEKRLAQCKALNGSKVSAAWQKVSG